MSNGLRINVNQQEFMEKPEAERSWMLYEGITHINKEGCYYARGHYRKLFPVVGFFGLAGGALVVLIRWIWG